MDGNVYLDAQQPKGRELGLLDFAHLQIHHSCPAMCALPMCFGNHCFTLLDSADTKGGCRLEKNESICFFLLVSLRPMHSSFWRGSMSLRQQFSLDCLCIISLNCIPASPGTIHYGYLAPHSQKIAINLS